MNRRGRHLLGAAMASLLLVACAVPPSATDAEEPAPMRPFVGRHRGMLRTNTKDAPPVPMQLDVEPIEGGGDRWRWRLQYGEGPEADVRDYVLVADDLATGRMRIDEGKGIELAASLHDDELVSVFAVHGKTLVVRYRAVAAGVQFVLESFAHEGGQATGHGVTTFPKVARQSAWLQRTAVGDDGSPKGR